MVPAGSKAHLSHLVKYRGTTEKNLPLQLCPISLLLAKMSTGGQTAVVSDRSPPILMTGQGGSPLLPALRYSGMCSLRPSGASSSRWLTSALCCQPSGTASSLCVSLFLPCMNDISHWEKICFWVRTLRMFTGSLDDNHAMQVNSFSVYRAGKEQRLWP